MYARAARHPAPRASTVSESQKLLCCACRCHHMAMHGGDEREITAPLTPSHILSSSKSSTSVLPLKRATSQSRSVADLLLAKNNLCSLQPGSPMCGVVVGSEWSKRMAGAGLTHVDATPERPILGISSSEPPQAFEAKSAWARLSTAAGLGPGSLPFVASAPRLRDSAPSQARQVATTNTPRRRRFVRGRVRSSDVLTPRTLAAAEIRLTSYLVGRPESSNGPSHGGSIKGSLERIGPSSREGGGDDQNDDPLGLENPAIREFWELEAPPLPIAPKQTAIEEQLEPLSEKAAVEVLRRASACSTLSDRELRLLLRAGTRKLFQRYALVMREGAAADGVFIVLQGKLQNQPSRIERQAISRARAMSEPAPRRQGNGLLGPSDSFGELSCILSLPRISIVVALEDTEVLQVSYAQLARLPIKPADAFLESLKTKFVATSLNSVPFFNTLPEQTRRQISELMEIEPFKKGEAICRQGDAGDCMYVVLYGRCEVMRQKKRGAPREKIAEYSGASPYPWFGEVVLWVVDHGRAGDVIVTEDMLALRLHRSLVQEFVFFAPGFKALSMSAATAFTIRTRTIKGIKEEEENQVFARRVDPPLKFLPQWTRIVTKLLGVAGGDQVASGVLMSVQQLRKKNLNTMEWIDDTLKREAGKVKWVPQTEMEELAMQERLDAQGQFDEQRRKMLVFANQKQFGDSKTLAEAATVGKVWRSDWGVHWSVRTELLHRPQFEIEMMEARKKMTFRMERPQESFPALLRPSGAPAQPT